MADLLWVRGLSLTLGGVECLDGIDLRLKAGEVLAVLGPNGAGKTSLLRCATGLWSPARGRVEFNGRSLDQWPLRDRARLLAVLPQSPVLDFPFTVEEVLLLGRIPHATGRGRDLAIAEAAMDQTDVAHLRRRDYRHLSGGEKQRVQLARVLAQIWEPVDGGDRLLVLDEPSTSLDLAHQQLLVQTVHLLADRGIGVLLVVHDLNLAARCADRILLLRAGRVAATGRPVEVLQSETLRSVFDVDVTLVEHRDSRAPLVLPG